MIAMGLWAAPVAGIAQAQAQATDQEIVVTSARPDDMAPTVVEHSIPLVAFDGLRAGKSGTLTIDDRAIRFQGDRDERRVPLRAVRFTAMEATTKALLRGTASTLASLAPNGAGQVYSAIRPGAALFTFFYTDAQDAVHAVVLLVPKASKDAIVARLAQAGLVAGDAASTFAKVDGPAPPPLRPRPPRAMAAALPSAADTLRIAVPESDGILPPSFVAATYEALIDEATKRGGYGTVWRQGDRRDQGGGSSLTLSVTAFKKGSAALRGAIPVVGMIAGKTLIRADLALDDAAGRPLLRREVKGSKRMMGESLAASTSLAQRAIKALAPDPRADRTPPPSSVEAS
jgi:hypothetical protein